MSQSNGSNGDQSQHLKKLSGCHLNILNVQLNDKSTTNYLIICQIIEMIGKIMSVNFSVDFDRYQGRCLVDMINYWINQKAK